MKYITSMEQLMSYLNLEIKRLENRRLDKMQSWQEGASLDGSLMALRKLKDKINLSKGAKEDLHEL